MALNKLTANLVDRKTPDIPMFDPPSIDQDVTGMSKFDESSPPIIAYQKGYRSSRMINIAGGPKEYPTILDIITPEVISHNDMGLPLIAYTSGYIPSWGNAIGGPIKYPTLLTGIVSGNPLIRFREPGDLGNAFKSNYDSLSPDDKFENLSVIINDKSVNNLDSALTEEYRKYDFDKGNPSRREPLITRDIGQGVGVEALNINNPVVNKILDAAVGGAATLVHRIILDAARIGKLLTLTPRGIMWGVKQVGLHLMNPKIETSLPGLARPNRIFNPIKFALNVITAPLGLHIERHGLSILPGKMDDYEKVQSAKFAANVITEKPITNRLYKLLMEREEGLEALVKIGSTLYTNLYSTDAVTLLKTRSFVLSGLGGPDSIYGIGGTNIPYSTDIFGGNADFKTQEKLEKHTTIESLYYPRPLKTPPGVHTEYPFKHEIESDPPRYGRIEPNFLWEVDRGFAPGDSDYKKSDTTPMFPVTPPAPEIPFGNKILGAAYLYDGIRKLAKDDSSEIPQSMISLYTSKFDPNEKYTEINIHTKYGIPDSGKSRMTGEFLPQPDLIMNNDVDTNIDLIEFRFGNSATTRFRAIITDNISVKENPNWKEEKYIGRPDPIFRYTGYKRTVSFGFMIVCESESQLEKMYDKVRALAALTRPVPNDINRMVGPLTHLKLGNYIQGNGFINSLSYDVDNKYIWDTKEELPMYIKVSVDFTFVYTADAPVPESEQSEQEETEQRNPEEVKVFYEMYDLEPGMYGSPNKYVTRD